MRDLPRTLFGTARRLAFLFAWGMGIAFAMVPAGCSSPGDGAASAGTGGGSSVTGAGGSQGASGGAQATGGSSSGGAPGSGSGGTGSGGSSPGTGGSSTGGAFGGGSGSGSGMSSGGTSGTGGSSTGGVVGSGGGTSSGGAGGRGGSSGGGGRAAGTGGSSGRGGNGPDAGADATPPMDATTGSDVNQGALPAITLHLAGDSTVMTYDATSAQEGWGQELGQFFISKLTIDNQAIGGASVDSFHSSSRWTNITSATKVGDYVMADFGINDSGTTAGRHVDPMPFQTLFSQMNDEITAKKATFIIVTPSALQYWSGGKETNARLEPYVTVLNALGTMKNILVDDLNARSLEYLNMIGQTSAMQIYINGDKAHFTKMGATQMAQFVAEELRRIGSPLAAYLK